MLFHMYSLHNKIGNHVGYAYVFTDVYKDRWTYGVYGRHVIGDHPTLVRFISLPLWQHCERLRRKQRSQ